MDVPKALGDYRGINITPVTARAFEKIVYHCYACETIASHLSTSQFAYRKGGNCTDALLSIQHRINTYLDNPDCTAVRLFAICDFSKAFDSVKHELLANKLASVNGPYLFNISIHDLNITLGNHDALFKCADDSTIIAPVWKKVDYSDQLVSQFLDWTNTNGMSCNPSKCKELTIKKRGNHDLYSPIGMIPSCKEVEILGVTFQCDSKFSVHVKNKLIKANKSLHILRTLRKEGYNQSEIDLLFNTIVLPNINYALSVYAASESDLTPVQCFLDRCFKRKYTSKPVSVYDFWVRP